MAPEPATHRDLAAAIGRALGRPSWCPVPPIALRIVLGEMADALLTSQRVQPTAALRLGYQFREPALQGALGRSLGRAA